MSNHPFQTRFEDLPGELPIFPLSGVVLLPFGRLPLNVFEPRYLNLTLDTLGQGRIFGMIQPTDPLSEDEAPPLYDTGCAGRITSFDETEDGRLMITLTGICRFRIRRELPPLRGYRRVEADYAAFRADMEQDSGAEFDRPRLVAALKPYFRAQGMDVNWKGIEAAPDWTLVNSLAMICPFEPREKQALLEAADIKSRAEVMTALLEMAAFGNGGTPAQQ